MAFEEQILEAAKAIAAATSALVKSAATAQRELVASGAVSNEINWQDIFFVDIENNFLHLIVSNDSKNKDIVDIFKVCSRSSDPNEDGQWSQGLVSAVSDWDILYLKLFKVYM